VFGAVSFLINVAAAISGVVGESDDLHDRPHVDNDDSDEVIGSYALVDVLEEEGELVVLIEIPGFYSEDITFKVREDILILVDGQDHEFHEILLPTGYNLDEATCMRFNNGVITIKYEKATKLPAKLAE
jgi:HSP20 family molecular chaperone IbpA